MSTLGFVEGAALSKTSFAPTPSGCEFTLPSPRLAAPATSVRDSSDHGSQRSNLSAVETASPPSSSMTTPPPLLAASLSCIFNFYIGRSDEAEVVGEERGYEGRNISSGVDKNTRSDEDDDDDDNGGGGSSKDADDSFGGKMCQVVSWFEAALHLFGWDFDIETK
ncbi:unnamed protein product [Urochloa humidicola]